MQKRKALAIGEGLHLIGFRSGRTGLRIWMPAQVIPVPTA